MAKPKVYMAGPLGFSEAGRAFHNGTLIPLVQRAGFEVLDPWTLTPQELIESALRLPYGEERKRRWQEVNKIIGRNNAKAIKDCDIIVAVLDGTDVDSGTAAEIGYGAALRKQVIGYRGDFRLSQDNEGSEVNLQVEHFVKLWGGQIVHDVESLEKLLVDWGEVLRRV